MPTHTKCSSWVATHNQPEKTLGELCLVDKVNQSQSKMNQFEELDPRRALVWIENIIQYKELTVVILSSTMIIVAFND